MRTFVKSLERLFNSGKITEDYLKQLLKNEKITPEEFTLLTNVI